MEMIAVIGSLPTFERFKRTLSPGSAKKMLHVDNPETVRGYEISDMILLHDSIAFTNHQEIVMAVQERVWKYSQTSHLSKTY